MAGRPSKYETHIKPHLEHIKKWAEQGATERQIAKQLGVAYSSFCLYKNKYSELSDLLKQKDMKPLVEEVKGKLVQLAMGFEYKEKKEYIKEDPETGNKVKYLEITTKQALPDRNAIYGVLNLYDPEYKKDKAYYELKKQDLELRRAIAEANNFDLDIN